MMAPKALFVVLLIVYGCFFFQQEQLEHQGPSTLDYPLPAVVQKTVLGYLRQLGAEMHFIKTAVFLGGNFTNDPTPSQADRLAANFEVMAELHPLFLDTYYLCQSSLAHIGPSWARQTNAVLEDGRAALPGQWVLPLFQSFNYHYYLRDELASARALRAAAALPGAPAWLGHLASIRAARRGEIYAGLIWLQAILNTEQEENSRARYKKELAAFEKAWAVQKAIVAYGRQSGGYPERLDDLIPRFISALPDFKGEFYLQWSPPDLKLKRPQRISPAGR